jgi:hypothetical protein
VSGNVREQEISHRRPRRLQHTLAVTALVCIVLAIGTILSAAARKRSLQPCTPSRELLAQALEQALREHPASAPGIPTVLLLTKEECEACRAALEDLEWAFAPAELGVQIFPLAVRNFPELAKELGVSPAYLFFDEDGNFTEGLRGYRAPEALRRWLSRLAQADSLSGPPSFP